MEFVAKLRKATIRNNREFYQITVDIKKLRKYPEIKKSEYVKVKLEAV